MVGGLGDFPGGSARHMSIRADPDFRPVSMSDRQDAGDADEIGGLHATELTPDADGMLAADEPPGILGRYAFVSCVVVLAE